MWKLSYCFLAAHYVTSTRLGNPFILDGFVMLKGFRCVITFNLLGGKLHKYTPTYLPAA